MTTDAETHPEHTEPGNTKAIHLQSQGGKQHVLEGVATRGALGRDFADAPAGCGVMTMDEFLEIEQDLIEEQQQLSGVRR